MKIFNNFKIRLVGDINPFNNLLFPFFVSFLGLYFALRTQSCVKNNSDRSKEKQYLKSLKNDLNSDIKRIDSVINILVVTSDGLDTALEQMQKPMINLNDIKLNYIMIMKYDWFPPQVNFNQGTITQLKSTGGLTLIENVSIVDSISAYDLGMQLCQKDANMVLDSYKETFSSQKYVYNYRDRLEFQDVIGVGNSYELQKFSNDTLIRYMSNNIRMATKDNSKIIACYNDFANYKASLELYFETLHRQRDLTYNLLTLISNMDL